jgi:hypothetical protein
MSHIIIIIMSHIIIACNYEYYRWLVEYMYNDLWMWNKTKLN